MQIANLSIDPLAITALGFLVAVLVISIGLFAWLMMAGGKKNKGA